VIGQLSALDRFLPAWILVAMALGLTLGAIVPRLNHALSSVESTGPSQALCTSIPCPVRDSITGKSLLG
jgi:ACR3 family arsenite transporter